MNKKKIVLIVVSVLIVLIITFIVLKLFIFKSNSIVCKKTDEINDIQFNYVYDAKYDKNKKMVSESRQTTMTFKTEEKYLSIKKNFQDNNLTAKYDDEKYIIYHEEEKKFDSIGYDVTYEKYKEVMSNSGHACVKK